MPTIRSATLTHEGGLRFSTVTGSGRAIVWGEDAELGELSPVETLTAAIAACSAMDVISIARKKRQGIDAYRIHVRAEQRDEAPKVLTTVDVVHEVFGPRVDEAAIRRAIELSADRYCPVSAMISAGATEVHHRYVVHNTGPTPFEAEGEVMVTGPYRRPDVVGG